MNQNKYIDFLSPEALEIFNELHDHLKRNNIHQEADYFSLSALANSYAVYREAARQLNEAGLLSKTKNGYVSANPLHNIMKTEMQNITKLSASFLLDPASRQRLFRGKLTGTKKKAENLTDGL